MVRIKVFLKLTFFLTLIDTIINEVRKEEVPILRIFNSEILSNLVCFIKII